MHARNEAINRQCVMDIVVRVIRRIRVLAPADNNVDEVLNLLRRQPWVKKSKCTEKLCLLCSMPANGRPIRRCLTFQDVVNRLA